jgi:hypothetical protein
MRYIFMDLWKIGTKNALKIPWRVPSNFHETYFEEIALHSMGPSSLYDCCYYDPFGAGFGEEILHRLSIIVENDQCFSHW